MSILRSEVILGKTPEEIEVASLVMVSIEEARKEKAAEIARELQRQKDAAAVATAVPDSTATSDCPAGYKGIATGTEYDAQQWRDWNCRGWYIANGMEPPFTAEELAAGILPRHDPPLAGIDVKDGIGTEESGAKAGHETSDASAKAAGADDSADKISSVSVDKGVLADEPLPVGHKVFVALDLPKGSNIVQVDDTCGIKPGMRFMLGTAPTTEIVKVLRFGSVVLCEGTTHNHPQGTPMTVLVGPNLELLLQPRRDRLRT